MFRGLVLAVLVVLTLPADTAQTPGVLRISVMLVDSAQQVTPVARHALLISDTPPSAAPRRVRTSVDGLVDVRLAPGTYTVESDQPAALDGKAFQWTVTVDMVAGGDVTIALTNENAEVVPLTDAVESALSSTEADPSSLLARWQDSVVAIWTATTRGSGFLFDADGLVATDQQVIGNATSVEVQLSPNVKVAGRVIASDAGRGIALIRINPSIAAAAKALPLACDTPTEPLVAHQDIVALEAPLARLRGSSSGAIEVVLVNVIDTDLRLSTGGSGGPVFAPDRRLIGLTTTVPERDGQPSSRTRVVRVGRVCELVASEAENIANTPPPSPTTLPVEPQPAGPDQKTAAARPPAGDSTRYRMSASDFDIMFITPAWLPALQAHADSNDIMERLQADFGNWSAYVDLAPPVLLIRVTPKFVEGFWTRVARGAASTMGASIPSLKRPKTNFDSMRVLCGDAEVIPVHPFKLEHRITDDETLVEGLYAFDPGALAPACASVTLQLFSEKEPEKADTIAVDPKVLEQIWKDFEVRSLRLPSPHLDRV